MIDSRNGGNKQDDHLRPIFNRLKMKDEETAKSRRVGQVAVIENHLSEKSGGEMDQSQCTMQPIPDNLIRPNQRTV
jgi:hypothetical protein